MGSKRLNIGLLISELEDDFCMNFCDGANAAAKEIDANLINTYEELIELISNFIYKNKELILERYEVYKKNN